MNFYNPTTSQVKSYKTFPAYIEIDGAFHQKSKDAILSSGWDEFGGKRGLSEGYTATGWHFVKDGSVWYQEPTGSTPTPAPEPHPRTILFPKEFVARFTTDERRALDALAASDDTAYDLRWMIQQAVEIDVTSQETIDGVGYLILKGILTFERGEEVLQPAYDA